ncbi:MAG: hypothetical protein ACQ5SW_09640 [Sphaerochaetaceae bacterium]
MNIITQKDKDSRREFHIGKRANISRPILFDVVQNLESPNANISICSDLSVDEAIEMRDALDEAIEGSKDKDTFPKESPEHKCEWEVWTSNDDALLLLDSPKIGDSPMLVMYGLPAIVRCKDELEDEEIAVSRHHIVAVRRKNG